LRPSHQRVRRWWLGRKLARRMRRARAGEDGAREWLEQHGFTVLDAQATQNSSLVVDEASTPFTVRADYLVERDGVRAVVEVKTGSVASPASRETRRQILEYAWVYGVDEVYLFDADAGELHRIGIPARGGNPALPTRSLQWVALAGVVGMIIGAVTAWYLTR